MATHSRSEPRVHLDPLSYTAHRLHHAKPEHLHITSRRVFVGPIPVDWLRGNRKEWQQHLHVHYSSRTASFSVSKDACKDRRVGDLDTAVADPSSVSPISEPLDSVASPESATVEDAPDRIMYAAENETPTPPTPALTFVDPDYARGSATSSVRASLEAANSRTTLLRRDAELESNGQGPSKSSLSQNKRVATSESRVSGGLVRFNAAVTRMEMDKEIQQMLEEQSRRRSLRRPRRSRHLHCRDGEIIKIGSMLVRVEITESRQLSEDFDENESLKINTRLVEKWREYVVVCREGFEHGLPTLSLHKSRTIRADENPKVSSHARVIDLERPKTNINIYSSLDKTLVVWHPYKHGTIIYIMRPRCSSASVEWYTFLRTCLGERRPESLFIGVPDLSLSLKIENPFAPVEEKLRDSDDADETELVFRERAVCENLIKTSVQLLDGVDEWLEVIEHWRKHEILGLAWRRYDRLEWVHGANEQRMHGSFAMQKTHELELRTKVHYPTVTKLPSGEKMTEPPPVEGFLIRLTSAQGKQEFMGRRFQKQLYFSSSDNLLFFCRPAVAFPPIPQGLLQRRGQDELPSAEDLASIPLIYSITPYAVNQEGEIEWLRGTDDYIDMKDRQAYEEAERRVNTVLNSEGFVNLCKVVEVRRQAPPPEDVAQPTLADAYKKNLELVLKNGLVLKLQSWNEQARDEWVLRLKDLVKYWKARDQADLVMVRRTRDANLKQLNVDEEMESILGQFARKWEVSRTMASAELYNVCGLSSCRAITMSGILYNKPRRRATFHRCNVVLSHGELLLFSNTARQATGKLVPTVYHERQFSISLEDCYIYSGQVTGSDLLYQNRTFDSNLPGRHGLPRYYADGYTAIDEDTMTCFVVWRGKKSLFNGKNGGGMTSKHKVSRLGATGKPHMFKARSRLERDAWVMSIAMEIERLNSGINEEIKVMPAKQK